MKEGLTGGDGEVTNIKYEVDAGCLQVLNDI